MISMPVVVHTDYFKWQLDLFWHCHKNVYGDDANNKAVALIVKRNYQEEPKIENFNWGIDMPYIMCEAYFDYLFLNKTFIDPVLYVPINIQTSLAQAIFNFEDEEVIEILDADMCYVRKPENINVKDDEIYVDTIYENWHLKSLNENKNVISMYFENNGDYYNGGFVPIIGKVKTFKKILREWILVHLDILARNYGANIKWWAGMFSLQVACEKAKVKMVAIKCCYVPVINQLEDSHYVVHYAVDKKFNKKTFPNINTEDFENNLFYKSVLSWIPNRI
jgi:hypothetical protein